MVPKRKLLENILLHNQRLNCKTNVCELEGHVGEKGLNLNWPTKFRLAKETPLVIFSNCLGESA
jgi:hypothetical protein